MEKYLDHFPTNRTGGNANRIVITLESLHKLNRIKDAIKNPYKIFIIDEVRSILQKFGGKTLDGQNSIAFEHLKMHIAMSDHIVFMDADLEYCMPFLDKIINEAYHDYRMDVSHQHERYIYMNIYQGGPKYSLKMIRDRKLFELISILAAKDPDSRTVYLFAKKKNAIKFMAEIAKLEGGNANFNRFGPNGEAPKHIGLIGAGPRTDFRECASDSPLGKAVIEALDDIKSPKCPVSMEFTRTFTTTPVINNGVSIEHCEDENGVAHGWTPNQFFFDMSAGSVNDVESDQMIGRFRIPDGKMATVYMYVEPLHTKYEDNETTMHEKLSLGVKSYLSNPLFHGKKLLLESSYFGTTNALLRG